MKQITSEILPVEGKPFPLGAGVWANNETNCFGLRGCMKGAEVFIRNGHTGTVIRCDFEAPASKEMWKYLEDMDAAMEPKDRFVSSDQHAMEFYYGVEDESIDGSELQYTIMPVPFFANDKEVAA